MLYYQRISPFILLLALSVSVGSRPVLAQSCSSFRDDDGTREGEATIDYTDDRLEKTVDLTTDPSTADFARLWIFGKPYNFPDQSFTRARTIKSR